MKRSIDDVSNTVLVHANKKPVFRSKAERQQIALKRLEKQLSIQYNQTPGEQCRDRRDRVREEKNKVREKDRITEKQAKKREAEEEVESIKERYFSGLQQRDAIGVAETGSGKAAAFISRKPKMRVIQPFEKFRFSFNWKNMY